MSNNFACNNINVGVLIGKRNILIGLIFLLTVSLKGQKNSFPYQLNKTDLVILPLAYAIGEYAHTKEQTVSLIEYSELIELNYKTINSIDRSAVHNWNYRLGHLSDKTRNTLVKSPLILVAGQIAGWEPKNAFTLGLMYIETITLTSEVTSLVKNIAQRKRPFLYSTKLSMEEKASTIENNVANSFFSGHTSMAFASAVFLSQTFTDIYGKSILSKSVWIASLSVAGLTGFLRFESGKHFPSDIVMGALAGSAIGYFIPMLHKSKNINENFNIELSAGHIRLIYTIG